LPTLAKLFVDLKQRFLERTGLLGARALLELERDPCPLGQAPHRFEEREVLVVLYERENVAALVAAEAMENLALRVDG